MREFPKFALGALAATLAFASGASASPTWSFDFLAGSVGQENPSSSFYVMSDLIVFDGTPTSPAPAGTHGSFTTPDGSSTGTFSNNTSSGSQQIYSNFSQFLSANANPGPWSMSVVLNSNTSTYNFSPDFSGISPSTIPTVGIPLLSPPDPNTGHAVTGNDLPTLQWTDTGNLTSLSVELYNSDLSINYFTSLPVSQTTWTPPSTLPVGSYTFVVQASIASSSIPLHPTLLTGPDVGLPSTATFNFSAADQMVFDVDPVVPEAVVSLTTTPPSGFGNSLGSLRITGDNGHYKPGSRSVSPTISGYVRTTRWNPVTDTEIYALKIADSDPDNLASDLAYLAEEINDNSFPDFTVDASTTDPTDGALTNITPGGFDFFLTFTNMDFGSSGDYFGFDLSQFNLNSDVLTASAVAVVPEPASLGLLLAVPLLLWRPRRRESAAL